MWCHAGLPRHNTRVTTLFLCKSFLHSFLRRLQPSVGRTFYITYYKPSMPQCNVTAALESFQFHNYIRHKMNVATAEKLVRGWSHGVLPPRDTWHVTPGARDTAAITWRVWRVSLPCNDDCPSDHQTCAELSCMIMNWLSSCNKHCQHFCAFPDFWNIRSASLQTNQRQEQYNFWLRKQTYES